MLQTFGIIALIAAGIILGEATLRNFVKNGGSTISPRTHMLILLAFAFAGWFIIAIAALAFAGLWIYKLFCKQRLKYLI